MTIGVDLRALQTGHKYRGIGEVAKQVTNRILELALHEANKPKFVFYEYDDDDPKELLTIPEGIDFTVVKLGAMPEGKGQVTKQEKIRRHTSDLIGNPVKDSHKSDVFLQFDYAFGVPKNTKTVLIKHDLIPLVFWKQFFESPWVHVRNKAARTTLRTLFNNTKYRRVLKRSVKNAKKIVAVSHSTKNDLISYLKTPDKKIKVVHLGVDIKPVKTGQNSVSKMPEKPYMLFVGAGDPRRRVEDAVHAFNNLKAKGFDIQLVLVGENFGSKKTIPNLSLRRVVNESSYKDDILTLGYVDDKTKQDLYKQATAYVYPTLYEGFGIPILEAMLLGCPVIVYANSSTTEVGGDVAIYVDGWEGIADQIKKLLVESKSMRKNRIEKARTYAQGFTWDSTAHAIYEELK